LWWRAAGHAVVSVICRRGGGDKPIQRIGGATIEAEPWHLVEILCFLRFFKRIL
jgi:hypothetical protein